MKTIKGIFAVAFMALCTLAFNACIEEAAPMVPEYEGDLVEMTFEASVAETKAAFDGKRINWEVGDKVAVYDGTAKREFTVQSVNAGVASIKGPVAADATEFYAVTPFSAAREALPGNDKIYFNLPTEQVLASGKDFDEDAFVAVGKVDGTRISFMNVVSLLKINIPENITSVSLRGFNSENIAGAANAGLDPKVAGGTEGSVVLKPAGETFAAGVHYIALLPSTFTKGFKVVYANDSNEISIKKNTGNIAFPINDGFDITAYTTADKLTTWIPNPLMDEEDLLYFVGNQAAYAGEEAKLGQDIALTKQWTPVDLYGTLDGQGHTISGLNVSATSGLGAMCSIQTGAALMNVTVSGDITYSAAPSQASRVGLVGYLHGTMYNVINKTNITATTTNQGVYLGGLAGQVSRGKMISCRNEGKVTIGTTKGVSYAGGMVGVIYPEDGLVQDCVNAGTVTSNATSTGALGGVVGLQQGGETVGCVNEGEIVASSMRSSGSVGGVIGVAYNCSDKVVKVHKCENDGKLTINAKGFRGVGGVVGGIDDASYYAKQTTPSATEISECKNKSAISVVAQKTESTAGINGFYLGGIVGSIYAPNTNTLVNSVKGCKNAGSITATTTGTNNSVVVGGISGNTRGPVVFEGNENAASVTLESTSADYRFCAAGGIVGQEGDPWSHDDTTPASFTNNVNRASVVSRIPNICCPAGGVIGYVFDPVTLKDNKNFGDVDRTYPDGTSCSDLSQIYSGGIVGLFFMSDKSQFLATLDGDKSFGSITSAGRAGLLFGGMKTGSQAKFVLSDCVVGGHLTSTYSNIDLDINSDNWDDRNGVKDGGYLWGFLRDGYYALEFNGNAYGTAASEDMPTLSAWQQGYMDIHHISTGRGNCTFMILPDGTTMMVDAGDNGPANDDSKLSRVPDESLTPAEWIVRYVTHFMDEAGLPVKLDHMLVSHFHYDHVGVGDNTYPWSPDGKYLMTGVPYVGSTLEIDNFVDRAYPDYDFPYTGYFDKGVFRDYVMMDNYLKFLESDYNRLNKISGFEVGASDQFALKTPRNDFSIRNVYANGQLWTGSGVSSASIVPSELTQSELQGAENQWSAVVNISYGDFDYHTGGDINGTELFDAEAEVAKRVGETDVFHCNHHACDDSMHADVLLSTNPQVFVVPAWETGHPGEEALSRMKIYGDVFAAGPVTDDSLKSGHVVVRVYQGGSTFRIFVLDDKSTDYGIVYQSDIYTSAN